MIASATFDFSGASVLVTGATSGIGYEIATAFGAAGAAVIACGTRPSASEYDVDLSAFTYRQCRLTEHSDVDSVLDGFEGLDVLVNNAGANLPGGRDEYDPDVFAETIAINLIGMQRLTTRCRPLLSASAMKGGSSIVSIASMAAMFGVPMVPGYSAAKAGLVGLTRALAVAWAAEGIRVNAIAPGVVETSMTAPMMDFPSLTDPLRARTPMGRFATPNEIAPTALFLASSAAAYVTGQTWCVDGGFSIAG